MPSPVLDSLSAVTLPLGLCYKLDDLEITADFYRFRKAYRQLLRSIKPKRIGALFMVGDILSCEIVDILLLQP